MFDEKTIEFIKNKIGPDGKLIITDDLTDKQKEKFQFINDLNVDILKVIARKNQRLNNEVNDNLDDNEDADEDDYSEINNSYEYESNSNVIIEENEDSIDDLTDFF